jgi:hypothetical protein
MSAYQEEDSPFWNKKNILGKLLAFCDRKLSSGDYPQYERSFSQFGEDLIVARVCANLGVKNPRYLDIGANDPRFRNNTYYFYLKGARGCCVEPDVRLCARIKRIRPEDICLNIGIVPSQKRGGGGGGVVFLLNFQSRVE